MKLCETCNIVHDGIYGSGRFCSSKCARSFSTKDKRTEISKKVSLKLKNSGNSNVYIACKFCHNIFTVNWNKRYRIFCSKSCSSKAISDETRKLISVKMKGKNKGELNGMYGKSPKNTKSIKIVSLKHQDDTNVTVRSSYEKLFIEEIDKDLNIVSFLYEPKQFKTIYIDKKNSKRTYQPDFLVNYVDGTCKVIEIKNKWSSSLEETQIKKDAFQNAFDIDYEIIVYG
jgi:hypothetical protein